MKKPKKRQIEDEAEDLADLLLSVEHNFDSAAKPKKRKITQETKPETVWEDAATRLKKWESTKSKSKKSRLDMSKWAELGLSDPIRAAVEDMGFSSPTAIQGEVLPVALTKRLDVFGAAETGSGKTLAFLIPILENLISAGPPSSDRQTAKDQRQLSALILAPTRELVMQINEEFKKVARFTDYRAVAVLGGLSEQKQERLLKRKPDVIIATPGRFWSLCQKLDYAGDFTGLRNVVIDEIDRMVEKGHFKELKNIVERVHSYDLPKLQTLVFSATLTFIVLPNATDSKSPRDAKPSREHKIREIARTTQMRRNYKVVDMTSETNTPSQLKERRLCCASLLEKDARLYFLLLTHPARTLIFANSIDASQRLYRILSKLQLQPEPLLLHAKMQERKRLKNLDRFAKGKNSVLIATDVAARGLDIKGIENVIHYQIPRTAEDYIHRSGRTARALQSGMSVMLLDPPDVLRYRKICKNLQRSEDDLVQLEIDGEKRMNALLNRCYLATEVEKMEFRLKKISGHESWTKRMAREADLELSDDSEPDPESHDSNQKRLKKAAEKALRHALSQPLPKSTLLPLKKD